MSWLDTLLSLFKRPAPQVPAVPPQTIPPSKPATAAAPAIEETVATPAMASPAWYPLCEKLTKASEDCVLVAYPDPASGGDPWTIGWGATGDGITKGTVWTQARADARLTADLLRFGAAVDSLVKVPLSPQQKAALVDFTFNLGSGNLQSSTLLKLLNAGDYAGAANEFAKWNLASGKVMPGLVTRRSRERSLFLTGVWK
ncbi:lysozyme [Caballeronia sp. DA-9]|uniref:lysozyme n=1 Tax=Caballeronia sp. DA-9 TaxID=3436237 RepID=UPI003F6701F6